MKKSACLLGSCLLAIPLLAQSTVIEITASGVINRSYDQFGTLFNQGTGDNVVNGKTAKITLWYDTTNLPSPSLEPSEATYSDLSRSWVDSKAWVDGIELDFVTGPGNYSNSDGLTIRNDYGYNSADALYVWDNAYHRINTNNTLGSFYSYTWDRNFFWSALTPRGFLKNLSPDQNFDVEAVGGMGEINPYFYQRICDGTGCTAITKYGYADFMFDSFTVTRVGAPAVPEPATIALLGMGLAGLGAARRRRKA